MSFWGELRRRNVFRVGVAYLAAVWLLLQVAGIVLASFEAPPWAMQALIFASTLGFPLAVVLAWFYELTPDGIRAASEEDIAEPVKFAGRKLDFVIIGLLVLAVGFLVVDTDMREDRGFVLPNSIAVLPFENLSSDPEQEYFSDGLSEELINKLGQLPGMNVSGRTSSFVFRGQNPSFQVIGETLGVEYVLEGSVRKVGGDLRISAQLIKAADGFNMWSNTYARQLDDVFTIQEEISLAVADALSLTLGVVKPDLTYGGTEIFEAYDHYLRGWEAWNVAPERAIDELQAAIAIDSEFALPWYLLTYSYGGVLRAATSDEAEQRALDEMERAALRAIDLASEKWETQSALTWVLVAKKDWLGAERAITNARTLARAAGIQITDTSYANYLHQIGRVEDALAEQQVVRRLDPLNFFHSFNIQIDLILLGRYEDAMAEYERNKELNNALNAMTFWGFPWYMEQGDVEAVNRFFADSPNPAAPELVDVWDAPDGALAILRRALDAPGHHRRADYQNLALIAAYYGDTGLAVELLRDAFLGGGYAGFFVMWHPVFGETRQTEGFKRFVRDLGFVELWRATGEWGDYCRPVSDNDFECV